MRSSAAFDKYGAPPELDQLSTPLPPTRRRYAKLQKNECQVMIGPNPADLGQSRLMGCQSGVPAGPNVAYWAFNVKKPPFDKKEVRLAMAMAIDKKTILKEVYQGTGASAATLIPPFMLGFNDKIADYRYDPEKAKAMLAAAGVKTPIDIDLWYQPVFRPYNPNGKRMGELMQADLAKIGVNAKLVTFEWGDYRKRLQNGEHLTGQMGWTGDNGDPDNFFFCSGAAREGGQNLSVVART